MLSELASARAAMDQALAGLTPEDMYITGVVGLWSVKDILAHGVAWESEIVTALNQAQNRRIPSMLRIEDIDEWNEEQQHVSARRPLEAVLSDYVGVHHKLKQMIADLDEDFLTDRRRFKWMEGEPLWYLVEESATLHEREHAEDIRRWRDSR